MTGRDAVVRGPEPGEPPFAIDTIEARARGGDGALVLEQLKLVGPTLDVALEGTYGSAADPKALSVKGQARKTAARTALRLWPNAVVPKVRAYLVANLRGGSADLIDVAVAISGADLDECGRRRADPGRLAVKVAFAVSGAELKIADGLPPRLGPCGVRALRPAPRPRLRAPSARVQMPEGRVARRARRHLRRPGHYWSKEAPAAIAFRLDGRRRRVGSPAAFAAPAGRQRRRSSTPPAIKGRAALRVGLNLPLKNIPRMDDLPLRISAARSAISSIDKFFGKDRLDGANLDRSLRRTAASR